MEKALDRWKMSGGVLSTRDIAFTAVFAALSVVIIMFIPGIPIVGMSGARITLDAAIAPIYGLVIGPYLGALAAFLGGIIVAGYKGWHLFSVLTSFCPAVSALIAGTLTSKREGPVRGWILSAVTLLILIAGWYGTGIGRGAPLYPVLHIAGLALILLLRGWASDLFESGVSWKLTFAVAAASYAGIIADHMLGNLIFITGIGWFIPLKVVEGWLSGLGLPSVSALFMYMLPVSTVERLAMTAVATLFGVALITALRASGLMPRRE